MEFIDTPSSSRKTHQLTNLYHNKHVSGVFYLETLSIHSANFFQEMQTPLSHFCIRLSAITLSNKVQYFFTMGTFFIETTSDINFAMYSLAGELDILFYKMFFKTLAEPNILIGMM